MLNTSSVDDGNGLVVLIANISHHTNPTTSETCCIGYFEACSHSITTHSFCLAAYIVDDANLVHSICSSC